MFVRDEKAGQVFITNYISEDMDQISPPCKFCTQCNVKDVNGSRNVSTSRILCLQVRMRNQSMFAVDKCRTVELLWSKSMSLVWTQDKADGSVALGLQTIFVTV